MFYDYISYFFHDLLDDALGQERLLSCRFANLGCEHVGKAKDQKRHEQTSECAAFRRRGRMLGNLNIPLHMYTYTHTHTHTHIYIYI
jgi:hypothetical protein